MLSSIVYSYAVDKKTSEKAVALLNPDFVSRRKDAETSELSCIRHHQGCKTVCTLDMNRPVTLLEEAGMGKTINKAATDELYGSMGSISLIITVNHFGHSAY